MPEVNEYEVEGGFRLSELFKVVKMSFGRMIIFAIIAAIIGGILSAVYIPVSIAANQRVSAVIDLAFPGISEGNDPYGVPFKRNSIITASIVHESTLVTFDGDLSKKHDLEKRLSVDEVIPASYIQQVNALTAQIKSNPMAQTEIDKLVYYPTRFIVTLDNYKSIGLSKKQATEFIDNVINQYQIEFKKTYVLSPVSLLIDKTIDYNSYDYIERYDVLYNQLSIIIEDIQRKISSSSLAAGYVSPTQQTTFATYRQQFDYLRNINLSRYYTFILNNGVTNNIINTITYMVNEYNTNLVRINQNDNDARSTYQAILAYKHTPLVVVGTGTTPVETTAASEKYDSMFADLMEKRLAAESYRTRCEIIKLQIEYYRDKYPGTITLERIPPTPDYSELPTSNTKAASPETQLVASLATTFVDELALPEAQAKSEADTMTEFISSQFLNHLKSLETFVIEFNQNELYSKAITPAINAYDSANSRSYFNNAIIMCLVIVGLAIVVAYLTTLVIYLDKRKKALGEIKGAKVTA